MGLFALSSSTTTATPSAIDSTIERTTTGRGASRRPEDARTSSSIRQDRGIDADGLREVGGPVAGREVEESGRTTVWDDPLEPHRNRRELLLPVLLTHQPVDLVVLMLGTNDLKHRFGAEPRDIAAGAGPLLDDVASSSCGPDGSPPRTLLVCPAPVARLTQFAEEFAGATEKSRAIPAQYASVAAA